MVERYDGEPLPPVHPQGRPPIGDGDRVPSPPPPPTSRRERTLAVVLVLVVLAAIVIRVLR